MPLYRWGADKLEPVPSTNFESESLMERGDLQRLLRDQSDALEKGLFIITEEYSNWKESGRSIDLLALDSKGHLVVIELKRTQTGDHSELQAIRYAAMVSNMTLNQVITAHREYLVKRGIDEDARVQVLNHLDAADEADAEIRTERPRIILASAGFSKELTTSVLWLRDGGMDISCVKLQLYSDGNGLLLDTSLDIPLPNARDYQTQVRVRQEEVRQQSQVTNTMGSDVFRQRIADMPERAQEELTRLCDLADYLEREGLARPMTRQGSTNTVLRVNLPGANTRLINAYITNPNGKSIGFYRGAWERHARESMNRLEEAIEPNALNVYGTYLAEWSDEMLAVVRDAYREANGVLPPTAPLPDTAPHTPGPAA